jgi:hypothetical protein
MSYSVSGRKFINNRSSNPRQSKISVTKTSYESKKKSSSSSSLLCWLLLGICFVSVVYLSFVFHITVTPTAITENIGTTLREIESMTVNRLRHQVDYSHNSLNYAQSNDRTSAVAAITSNPTLSPTSLPDRCPGRQVVPEFILPSNRSEKGASNMHFIHIPKCGGTSMTAVLREMACAMNPSVNLDCCKNPGFCDWHAFRRCSVIKGCTDHFPNRAWIYKPQPSIALFREPTSRYFN